MWENTRDFLKVEIQHKFLLHKTEIVELFDFEPA